MLLQVLFDSGWSRRSVDLWLGRDTRRDKTRQAAESRKGEEEKRRDRDKTTRAVYTVDRGETAGKRQREGIRHGPRHGNNHDGSREAERRRRDRLVAAGRHARVDALALDPRGRAAVAAHGRRLLLLVVVTVNAAAGARVLAARGRVRVCGGGVGAAGGRAGHDPDPALSRLARRSVRRDAGGAGLVRLVPRHVGWAAGRGGAQPAHLTHLRFAGALVLQRAAE